VAELVKLGESATLEFKSSARWNLLAGGRDERLEHRILVTLAAFMNADGGTLLVGVDDAGNALGLEHDYSLLRRQDSDGWRSWLTDHIASGIDRTAPANLSVEFERVNDLEVCRITARPSTRPVWVKGPAGQEFYVRFDNSTRQLVGEEVLRYVSDRWGELAPRGV
jgi:predicted HTH transcriptional regulator